MDVYQQAINELHKIDDEIKSLQQRRDSLDKFVSLGASLFYEQVTATPAAYFKPLFTGSSKSGSASGAKTASVSTSRSVVESESEAHIKVYGPTKTKDLLTILNAQGVHVGGNDPVGTLSVLLSRSGRFVASRKFGWSIAQEKVNPADAPTSAGFDDDLLALDRDPDLRRTDAEERLRGA